MLDSMDTHQGLPHKVSRQTLYEDCIQLFEKKLKSILLEYPFRVVYENERAVDTGGVCRDMFSAFWELAYVRDFDGGNTYIPIVHPHTDISRYAVLGSILSYGYMSCGILPNRLSFPVLVYTLLGCGVIIPDPLMIELFIDYVSNYESSIFRQALIESKKQLHRSFTPQLQDSLITIANS